MSATARALCPPASDFRNSLLPSRRPGPAIVHNIKATAAPEERPCALDVCFNFFTPKRRRQLCCSKGCQLQAARQANKRAQRGSNPFRHIRVRVNGRRIYLHRHIVELHLGRPLADDEVVHHRDGNKHHNCYLPREFCGSLFCEGNLELLTGDAARAHIRYHLEQLLRARRNWKGKR